MGKSLAEALGCTARQDFDSAAGARVQRRIGFETMLGGRQAFPGKVRQASASTRTERLPILQRVPHLGIPCHRDDTMGIEPEHRTGFAQALVVRVRIRQELPRERIDVQRRAVGLRLGHLGPLNTGAAVYGRGRNPKNGSVRWSSST